MKPVSTLLAAMTAATLIAAPADARPKPVWEIGIGAGVSYSPDYWGSDHSSVGGIPLAYLSYRGKDFSLLSNGLYDVPADDKNRFGFGLSLGFQGQVKSEDRLGLPEINYVGEIGPEVTFALFANGEQRLQVSLAARAAYEWNEGYAGYVIEPEIAYLTKLSSVARVGLYVTPKFGFDGYNQLYYSTPGFAASDGYVGTEIAGKLAYDLTDRTRIAAKIGAISLSGAENDLSPLVRDEWNFTARLSLSYAIFQSSEMTED